eukprot:TRINITY_DN8814_c0_g1_i1.p1 TRINITY_DN8814_c0_g1~~TRINITY_DN8814_c0_g1_i1.p1  ORF type:complete len:140 (-),score=30.42 TRINITY_DN8814_c0_g1_i1:37-456(-)
MSSLNGHCLCGDIEFKIEGEPVAVYLCHCKDCQTISGSCFGTTSAKAEPKNFKILKGEPKHYETKSDAGNIVAKMFCPRCGTNIGSVGKKGTPDEYVSVRSGSMENPPQPKQELYMKSKPSWVQPMVPENSRFDGMPHK